MTVSSAYSDIRTSHLIPRRRDAILCRLVERSVVLLVSAPCLRSGHSMQPQTAWSAMQTKRRCPAGAFGPMHRWFPRPHRDGEEAA